MALTDTAIKAIKPTGKPQKLFDAGGLFLFVAVTGTKSWRMKYRFQGKEKLLTLGTYPQISLKEARDKAGASKKLLADGIDPSVEKKVDTPDTPTSGGTFEAVALEWVERQSPSWVVGHRKRILGRLESMVFPYIGNMPAAEISPSDILNFVRMIESDSKNYTAGRVLGMCSQVFRYAVACGICGSDPCRDLRGALTVHVETPRAALTSPKDAGGLMASIFAYQGSSVVRAALLWSAYTFGRPGEVRRAEWLEIEWDKKEWRIPAEKMKMRQEHRVPLARQCMEILEGLREKKLSDNWIFPGPRPSRPLSENGVLSALRRMGYEKHEMTAHGFRAMASTLLNELGYRPDVIERQLAHGDTDKVRAVYNRAAYMDERRAMMQEWADYLDGLAAKQTLRLRQVDPE